MRRYRFVVKQGDGSTQLGQGFVGSERPPQARLIFFLSPQVPFSIAVE